MPIHLCASPPSRAAFGPDDAAALGLLGPGLLAAHCSAVDDDDIAVLGASGIGVAHCPSAALAMGASVFTPLARLRSAGATGSLGLDNASLYAGSDMFEEARRAQHTAHLMGAGLDATTLLDLLTIEGARAAGLGDHVGSLEVGKRADLVVLDASGSHWSAVRGSWPDRVVGAARADDVQAVYVDGHAVARHGTALHQPDRAVVAEVLARIPALMGWSPPSGGG
jgi:5-methylthioadenosine/S-adenosylhomocysteine deaminase